TTSVLTITNVQSADAGTYSVAVTNAAGFVTPAAVLSVVSSPTFSTVSFVSTNVVLSFTTPSTSDNTSSFTLQSSPVVTGPYTNTPATFTGANGTFQVTVPQGGSNMFYRLLHN